MKKSNNNPSENCLSAAAEQGFSLVELVIVMTLFAVILAIGSNTFTLLLKQSTQQSKMTEGQIERIAGLELLRSDVASAGFGLPWSFQNAISYAEALDPAHPLAANYNDAPAAPPRAIFSGNNVGVNGSDYLVLKGTAFGNSATNTTASKWSYITTGAATPKIWGSNDLTDGVDKAIVVVPQSSATSVRQLVMNGLAFYTTYSKNAFPASFSPSSPGGMYMIYGLDSTAALRMPFNRVDYFISQASGLVPSSCAPNTGELVRAYVSQTDGTLTNPPLPILDCVADMQIVYQIDPNGNGNLQQTDDISLLTAQQIAQQVKEIRIYILTHEGKADTNFSYPLSGNPITVGEFGLGSTFNLSTSNPGWRNYRWKVQTLVVKPNNLY